MTTKEQISNNWYVITGAPSSGKTTLLEYLKKKGQKVYFEWARIYIDQEMNAKFAKNLRFLTNSIL